MKLKKPIFGWDEETGVATCVLYDNKNHTYAGIAHCHPNDKDMCSKLVGFQIAYKRAYITFLKKLKNILSDRKHFLEVIIKEMKDSPYFSEKDFGVRKINKELNKLENNLINTKIFIKKMDKELSEYIADKEEFYQKIRTKRAKGQE